MYVTDNDARKAGGIITTPDMKSVIVVMNRHSAWKGENKWGLPKGHPREGEPPSQCAQREVLEETGLSFTPDRFKRHIYLNGNYYYIIVLRAPFNRFKTNDTKEISEVKWMKISELRESNFNSDIKRFLKIFPNDRVEFTRPPRLSNHTPERPHTRNWCRGYQHPTNHPNVNNIRQLGCT